MNYIGLSSFKYVGWVSRYENMIVDKNYDDIKHIVEKNLY